MEGEEELQAPEQRSPCSPVVKAMVKQAVPLQPVEEGGGGVEIPPAARGGPQAGAGGGT